MPKNVTILLTLPFLLCISVSAQHDPGRNATRLLAKGETNAAIKVASKAPKRMNSPISEGERYFVLTMAACIQGDADEAFKYAQEAVANGLPV